MLATTHVPLPCVWSDAFAAGPKPESSTVRIRAVDPIVNVVVPDAPVRISPFELVKSRVPFTTSEPATPDNVI